MRAAGHRDDALPPLSLACVIEDRHAPGRLDDLEIETGVAAEVGQHRRHAALAETAILRTVGAIDRAASRSPAPPPLRRPPPRPPSRSTAAPRLASVTAARTYRLRSLASCSCTGPS